MPVGMMSAGVAQAMTNFRPSFVVTRSAAFGSVIDRMAEALQHLGNDAAESRGRHGCATLRAGGQARH